MKGTFVVLFESRRATYSLSAAELQDEFNTARAIEGQVVKGRSFNLPALCSKIS